jgi:hypothetical protein
LHSLLLAILLSAPIQRGHGRPPNFTVSPPQRDKLLADIEKDLRSDFIFPEKLDLFLPALKARWKAPDFRKLNDAHAIVDHLNSGLMAVVHDGHLNLRLAAALPSGAFDDPDKDDEPKVAAELEAMDKRGHFGVLKAQVLPGNVGVLELSSFARRSAGQREAYAAAMTFLKDTEALIIDLRANGGGDGESVADLVGYFLDHRALLQWDIARDGKQHEHFSAERVDGPPYGTARAVYVLISKETFSAAEECAYDLQTQKRARVVGEASGGGANHNRFFRVGDGFALSVPYLTTKNAVTGINWEGTGVPPDVKVPAAAALKTAHRLVIEKELATEQDPRRKAMLKDLISTL